MNKQHHLFIFPGLGDDIRFYKWITRNWNQKYRIISHVLPVGWYDKTSDFNSKLLKLVKKIEPYINDNHVMSFMGCSAGASMAINVWRYLVKQKIKVDGGIIINCGRLRKGTSRGIRSLKFAAKNSPAFKESVLNCEKELQLLKIIDKKKILTFKGVFDELVPASTTTVDGANNIQVPSIEHLISMGIVLIFYSKTIANFLNSQKN